MKQKIIRLAVLCMAMVMLLSVVGCGGTTTTPQESVNITLDNAAGDPPEQLELQKQIKTMGEDITVLTFMVDNLTRAIEEQRYTQFCGGTIKWVSSEGYSELQQKLAAMHMTDEAPDIYPMSNQDFPSILYKGILMPLDDVIDLENKVFDDIKVYIDGLRWNGECYFIPVIGNEQDLMVNNALLRDAGIPESEWPTAQYEANTWSCDAMYDLMKRVSRPEEGITGFASGYNLLYMFACSAGADFVKMTEDGIASNVKSEEVTRAMNMMIKCTTNKNYSGGGLEGFKRGKVCMYYDLLSYTADDILGEQLANGDISFVPFPRDPKVDTHYGMGSITGDAIPLGAKHVDGAAAYILSKYASNYYTNEANKLFAKQRNWDEKAMDYYYNNLMKREATLCFSLGIKEIQNMMWTATSAKNLTEKGNWETIANELDPKIQQELDMLG